MKQFVNISYVKLIALHAAIGFGIFLVPLLSKVYLLGIMVYFLFRIFRNGNRGDEALYAAAYLMGAELILRMTNAAPLYEFVKYVVILFLFLGMIYRGISRNSVPYLFFIILLIPSIVVGVMNIEDITKIRSNITFNLSGPFCLGIAAIYCYKKKISTTRLNEIMTAIVLPIITTMVYLFFYTPDLEDTIRGTAANYAASGGFGPNQVATVLGLGAYLLFVRLMKHKKIMLFVVDGVLLASMMYRAWATFSRGGVLTAGLMILATLVVFYFMLPKRSPHKKPSVAIIALLFVGLTVTYIYTSLKTEGLLDNRYSNKDAAGKVKEDISTGRGALLISELDAFMENPVVGVGAGAVKEYRLRKFRIDAATHNEVSRLLSEHGSIGILALLLLILVPLLSRLRGHTNPYFYAFIIFWFATINHSSMRLSAPAVLYGLALLHEVYPVRRKQLKKHNTNNTQAPVREVA